MPEPCIRKRLETFMHTRHFHTWLCAAALAFASTAVLGQTAAPGGFPSRPVRIINPFPAGSGPDAVARIVAERLSRAWGQPVVVDNRPGASGFIALQAARQAPPTGHDLVIAAADHMAINPALYRKMPYSPTRDFVPVGGLYRTSFFVLVSEQGEFKTVPQLLAFARGAPNRATYGSNSVGSPLHLGGAQIEAATGTTMQHIAFRETTALYQTVASGDVTWALGSIGSAGALITGRKLRVLAVADTRRSAAMPDVPTLAEAGGPKVSVPTWVALFAPAGTPPAIALDIQKAVQAALDITEVKARFQVMGFQPAPVAGSEVTKWITSDQAHYAALVKQTGATID